MKESQPTNVYTPLPREGSGGGVFPLSPEGFGGGVFPSYYLAPISYYAQLLRCPSVTIDVNEIYRKQTLRNRCYIASPNGRMALTIPVVKFVPYHTPMRDIRISDHGNWRHLHWNALQSNYGRTPFFEFYADDFAPFYEKRWDFLVDYNQALQEMVLREIGDPSPLTPPPNGRETLSPSCSGEGTKGRRAEYYQLFSDRNGFLPDLSIVDLLFNMGPEAILYLMHNA